MTLGRIFLSFGSLILNFLHCISYEKNIETKEKGRVGGEHFYNALGRTDV